MIMYFFNLQITDMGKQKRSRQKFHNTAVKPKGDKKQEDEDATLEVTLCTCHHNPCLNK